MDNLNRNMYAYDTEQDVNALFNTMANITKFYNIIG